MMPEPQKTNEGLGKGTIRHEIRLLSIVGSILIGVFAVLYWVLGRTIVEKTITELAMPVGFFWSLLTIGIWVSWRLRQRAIMGILVAGWLAITVFGNRHFANYLMASLERPYIDFELQQESPFDVVVVLGGGTETAVDGRPSLGDSGDRIRVATELFHAGKASHFLCTGKQKYRWAPNDLDPSDESSLLLQALGVPSNQVETLSGANTSEEARNLKQWIAEHPGVQRIGLVTSAWHLDRALRLTKKQGLSAVGIPADFRSRSVQAIEFHVVPNAYTLHLSSLGLKERLAGLVGR